MDWSKYSFVVRSKNRKLVLLHLDKPKTPAQIAGELKLSLPHVSRAIRELEREGLVECLTPNEKVGRIYKRTELGEEVVNALQE
ncbi:transcriptional regulator, MarR family [Ferroglobus placidus DSM 10642]|uniref:Transcriptional regulator, MarR family n=1 Tax=Ferroglobus placidus (strain DSM 10642 / AEDII12DO) TaxID=589924 RepID=D3S1R0_FERPA|nr:MarR family transcriptional regulator [Ferroglobus placidus]ADC64367.1 transcriptional regulator, MarR family [Ferroglobus placidus DSM 10642]